MIQDVNSAFSPDQSVLLLLNCYTVAAPQTQVQLTPPPCLVR